MKYIYAIAFLACILAANWAITHVGTPTPGGPHVVPVGFGLSAPSGVYVVGLTLVLRDVVQRSFGKPVTLGLIVAGAGLTVLFAPSLAVASGLAFLLSETADFAVFSLTERWGFTVAVALSNAVSIVIDSLVFLAVAFGSLAFLEGQILGKGIATVVALIAIVAVRARRRVVVA